MPQWMFNSFNPGRFHQVFGKASDAEVMALLKVVEFEMGGGPDDEFAQIAGRLARQGISYHGINPRDAEAIDQVITIAIGPEGLWTELEMEQESGQGLNNRVVDELLKRAAANNIHVDLLPALKKGRRYGSVDLGPACNYVVFDRNEVAKLAQEVTSLVELNAPWSSPAIQNEATEGLQMVFEYVSRKRKGIAGVLS
ncbi:MAG TPA: hypothetical protein PLN21_15250 [Gemmatales bacterium]|nr:hypothetical protein [Gemmatales bacterium]